MSVTTLTRKDVRYWFFRFKTEADGGATADDAPAGLRETYEGSIPFQLTNGWVGFGSLWDVRENAHGEMVIIPLDTSIWDVWLEECRKIARELPEKDEKRAAKIERPAVVEHLEVDAVIQ